MSTNQGVVGLNPAGRGKIRSKIRGLGLTTQALFLCSVPLEQGCTFDEA